MTDPTQSPGPGRDPAGRPPVVADPPAPAGPDEFAGAVLAEQLYDQLGDDGFASLTDHIARLLERLARDLPPLTEPPPADSREDDLVEHEQAERQELLDRIARAPVLFGVQRGPRSPVL